MGSLRLAKKEGLLSVCLALTWALPSPANAQKGQSHVLVCPGGSSHEGIQWLRHMLPQVAPEQQVRVLDPAVSREATSEQKQFTSQLAANVRRARKLFSELELKPANRVLSRALKRIDKSFDKLADVTVLTDAYALHAAVLLLLNQEKRARNILESLFVLAPNRPADETLYNPDTLAVYEAVASRVRASSRAKIVVGIEPKRSGVFVDGDFVGLAPATAHSVIPGPHLVTMVAPGFEALRRAVKVSRGKSEVGGALKPQSSANDISRLVEQTYKGATQALSEPAEDLLGKLDAEGLIMLRPAGKRIEAVLISRNGERRTTKVKPPNNLKQARQRAEVILKALDSPANAGASDTLSDAPPPKDDRKVVRARDSQGNPPQVREEPSGGPSPLVWGLYAGAVAAGLGGLYFGKKARDAENEYNLGSPGSSGESTSQVEGQDIADQGKQNALIADILYGTALISGTIGLILHLMGEDEPSTSANRAAPQSTGWALGINSVQYRF